MSIRKIHLFALHVSCSISYFITHLGFRQAFFDFRIVANFFAQKRKNKDYIPDDPTEIKYVDEVLKLLNVMTGDKRYEKIFQKKKGVRSMCDVAERLEKMGIVKGIEIGRLEGKEEGKVEGKAEGILEGKMQVYRNLLKKGFTEKEAREITEIS